MYDREKWRERVRDIRACGTTWWWWWWLLVLCLLLSSSTQCLIWKLHKCMYNVGWTIMQRIRRKNMFCVKAEEAVDYTTVTREFKNFCPSYKSRDTLASSDRSNSVDFIVLLQVIMINLATSNWRVSGELGITQSSVSYPFKTSRKASGATELGESPYSFWNNLI